MPNSPEPASLAVVEVDVDELTLNEQNPRKIDAERLAALKSSLQDDPDLLRARPVIAARD